MSSLVLDLAICHVTSRVEHRQLIFSPEAEEEFRKFMRMYERLPSFRVLAYRLMTKHFHLLLEVPSLPAARSREKVRTWNSCRRRRERRPASAVRKS